MKLMIAGSRSIKDFDISPYIPEGVEMIISGGATGIDALAEGYADKHRLSKMILRPRYDLYAKASPLKRNEQMIEEANTILIFWDGKSRGTEYTIKKSKNMNKKITVIKVTK